MLKKICAFISTAFKVDRDVSIPEKEKQPFIISWADETSRAICAKASKGQFYKFDLENAKSYLRKSEEKLKEKYSAGSVELDNLSDAKALFASRIEWIKETDKRYHDWVKMAEEHARNADGFVYRVNESAYKYMLVTYGGAFLFALNAFISDELSNELIGPLTSSLWVLVFGLFFTITFIWLTMEIQGKFRDYNNDRIAAWDLDEVKEPFLVKWPMDYLTRLMAVLAMTALPFSAFVFVYRIDIEGYIRPFIPFID